MSVELTGTVGIVKFRNPHLAMTLVASGETGGEPITYSLEGAPANMLVRLGLEPSMIKPGTPLRIIAAPRKDDPNAWLVKAIVLQDGTRFQLLN